jgi:iron only hydrogenase large subunit-like protein
MSVFLSNLDDFIAPGQACVNPLVQSKATEAPTTGGRITLETDFSTSEFAVLKQEPNLIRSRTGTTSKVATVSLNDCLACSGCVTTAETVLIQSQSHERLLDKFAEARTTPDLKIAVAISPQSRASLAEKLGLPSEELFLKLATILKSMGVTYVLDTASAGDVSLVEAREEFLHRYRGEKRRSWSAPAVTSAVNSREINNYGKTDDVEAPLSITGTTQVGTPTRPTFGPMIISHCPGWVCYAEKTLPEALPYVSSTKSSQQILGAALKRYWAPEGVPDNLFVACVQPCFDKKLEGSRLDFLDGDTNVQEIDLVISTTELWLLLEQHATENSSSPNELIENAVLDEPTGNGEVERLFRCFSEAGQQLVLSADTEAGSGGYLDYIVRYAAQSELGKEIGSSGEITYRVGRNADIADVEVCAANVDSTESEAPPQTLRAAKVYGFRNIQSTMLKLKRGKCNYDIMEVMACPSGCINGGGQLRANERETATESKERIAAVDKVYHTVQVRSPDDSPLVHYLYAAERLQGPLSDEAMGLLHTRYHTVPKLEEIAPLAAKW